LIESIRTVPEFILFPVGMGYSRPLVPEDHPLSRYINRRVEFILILDNGTEIRPELP